MVPNPVLPCSFEHIQKLFIFSLNDVHPVHATPFRVMFTQPHTQVHQNSQVFIPLNNNNPKNKQTKIKPKQTTCDLEPSWVRHTHEATMTSVGRIQQVAKRNSWVSLHYTFHMQKSWIPKASTGGKWHLVRDLETSNWPTKTITTFAPC